MASDDDWPLRTHVRVEATTSASRPRVGRTELSRTENVRRPRRVPLSPLADITQQQGFERRQASTPTTPITSPTTLDASQKSFQESNILFIVNAGLPSHRTFKAFVHQLLLKRHCPVSPTVTRMAFWNQATNQYVVQELTVSDGRLTSCVADVGSVRGSAHILLPMQREADLIVVFTGKDSVRPSQRSILGAERFGSDGLQNIPHIVVLGHEASRGPCSPKEAVDAAWDFVRLPNVAILQQATWTRGSFGFCQILHISGCLKSLRSLGAFNGHGVNNLVEWADLPILDRPEDAFLRIVLTSQRTEDNSSSLAATTSEIGLLNRARRGFNFVSDLPVVEPRQPVVEDQSRSEVRRAAERVNRISVLMNTRGNNPELPRLRQELRTAHRRSSRLLPINITPASAPQQRNSTGFRGECSLCCEEDSQLVFLLKKSASAQSWYAGDIHWPFSEGCLPENDIISAFMCCDNCSFYVVEGGNTPIREPATAAFSLVPYAANADRWKEDLAKGMDQYSETSRDLLPLVFLAVVEETLRTKSWASSDGSDENEIRRNALIWVRRQILDYVHISGDDHEGYVGDWVKGVLLSPKKGRQSIIWSYPIPGFAVMMRLVEADKEQKAKVLWRRMLVELTRQARRAPLSTGVDDIAVKVMEVNDQLLSEDDGDWISVIGEKGLLDSAAMEGFTHLDEIAWVTAHTRFAIVLWLRWLPSVEDLEGTTGEIVDQIAEVDCGEVVMWAPEQVTRDWCVG